MRVKPSRHATRDRLHDWFRADVEAPLAQRVGGEEPLRLILLLAGVLALDSADKATIGAVVADLERSLRIGNVEVGWLVTASTGIGAVFTLPFSVFADRAHRTHLLAIAIVAWSLAMAAGAASPSATCCSATSRRSHRGACRSPCSPSSGSR